MAQKNTNAETHPFFPSGEWEGFYHCDFSSARHRMDCLLTFCERIVAGCGSDDAGAFRWDGIYHTDACTCTITKQYMGRHQVRYDGHADENGIWGTWHIGPSFKAGSTCGQKAGRKQKNTNGKRNRSSLPFRSRASDEQPYASF